MSSLPGEAALSAFAVLTRHFLASLRRPRMLDDAGQEGLHRVFLGALAGAVAAGLLLMRVFSVKYQALARDSDAFLPVLAADTAFLLSIPMLLVAALANLHASALFPDDTDYRICMVLPVKRAVVFRAKLAALAIFVCTVVAVIHAALLPLLLLMWSGEGLSYALLVRLPAFAVAGVGASAMALVAVIAAHGLMHVLLPPRLRARATAPLRSAIIAAIMSLVPLAIGLSSLGTAISARAAWLSTVPPLWFVGVEHVLMGRADAQFAHFARIGLAALAVGLTLAVALYTHTYRRFDSRAAMTAWGPVSGAWRERWRGRLGVRRSSCEGVYRFASATLWRSPLHQGVFTSIAAIGLGIVVQRGVANTNALLAMPFVLILLACPGLRLALSLPHQWRANWIFRQTEREESRPRQLRATTRLFWRFGIVAPTVVVAPVQLWMGGLQTLTSVPVALAFGWLLVECLLRRWRRIPFTCTYLPGQRVMAGTVFVVSNSALLFVFAGVLVSRGLWTHPRVAATTLAIVLASATWLRTARMSLWRTAPLEFDAAPEDDVQVLGVAFASPQQ